MWSTSLNERHTNNEPSKNHWSTKWLLNPDWWEHFSSWNGLTCKNIPFRFMSRKYVAKKQKQKGEHKYGEKSPTVNWTCSRVVGSGPWEMKHERWKVDVLGCLDLVKRGKAKQERLSQNLASEDGATCQMVASLTLPFTPAGPNKIQKKSVLRSNVFQWDTHI